MSSTVSAGVQYDNLARRYHVTLQRRRPARRYADARPRRAGAPMADRFERLEPVQQRPARAERRVLRPRPRAHDAAEHVVRLALAGHRRRRPREVHLPPLRTRAGIARTAKIAIIAKIRRHCQDCALVTCVRVLVLSRGVALQRESPNRWQSWQFWQFWQFAMATTLRDVRPAALPSGRVPAGSARRAGRSATTRG